MSGFKDLFGDEAYPNSPGWRDPVTSKMAAAEFKETAETLRARVLLALGVRPATVHEMAARLDRPVPSVQPRFSELKAQGKIRWTGELRLNQASHKRAKVWEAIK